MLTRGIVMIAMGAEYERLTAATIRHSMRHTALPITVILNRDNPEGAWDGLPVHRIVVDCPTNENRRIKTQLYKYTPYGQTLYMDADAVVQTPGIERIFDGLKIAPAVFQVHTTWGKFKKYYDIYRRAMHQFDCSLPTDILIGGFFAFKKDPRVEVFFDLWLEYWMEFGCGRDMPPLACAAKNSGLPYHAITVDRQKLFSFGYRSDCVVVHRVQGDDLTKKFGIPMHKPNKPFDVGHKDDWNLVYFDEIQNEWLKKKVNIPRQDKIERAYIANYFPSLRTGGKRVLDIGCGYGQFLLCCQRYGNTVVGIVPPLEKYENKRGVPNSDSLDYELFCRERLAKIRTSYVEGDMEEVIFNAAPLPVEGVFDIINCKHALNLIFNKCFDFGADIRNYKNDGAWLIDDKFRAAFSALLDAVKEKLAPKGIFFIASLNSTNALEYSAEVTALAMHAGFTVESFRVGHNHRFTRVA